MQITALPINFAQGLDTKTDPKQVQMGKFVALQNSIFDKGGLLQKRNGYKELTALVSPAAYLTTLNDNLTAIGTNIQAYSTGTENWVSRGTIQPMQVSTLPLIRNSINQIQCDAAVAANGLVCTVYSEINNGTKDYKYAIADSATGQNIVAPTLIPVSSGVVTGSPRVFLIGFYFIIVFTNVISTVSHLQYIAISSNNPSVATTNQDIASVYIPATTLSWDGVVVNSQLFLAYNTTSGGQAVKVTYLTENAASSGAIPTTAVTFASRKATMMTLTTDTSQATGINSPSNPTVYVSFYDSSGSTGYSLAVDQNLNTLMSPTQIISSGTYLNLTSAAQNGVVRVYGEVSNAYSYDSGIASNYINAIPVTLPATVTTGTVGSTTVTVRSVGLASKAFIVNGVQYFLAAYSSSYQPSYFLINGSTSTSAAPVISGKLAYSNGGGYLTLGLPNVTVSSENIAQVPYLYKDLIAAVNKNTAVPAGTQVAGIYSQTGINLGTFDITTVGIDTAEIASSLHISGGFLWMYDGYLPVEHNFFLWPDSVECTWSATGGGIAAQPDGSTNTNAYYYQVTYEWADNNGLIQRSAPSIPIAVTTTGSGSAGSITVNVPYLRLTYKTANPAKVVIYRWSVKQPVYYQVTSLTVAQLNSTTSDSLTFVDTLADASILGNNILYTTGGVVEDVNAPASNIMTLFDTRLWLVDAEDPNLLWFSKQIIESVPVEMSDLFTFYVAPTTAAQGSTGPITALAPMDDKLIIFKANAIYYINGTGPDNTGNGNQYSQPIWITSTVGCSDQQSIVFTSTGLQFQSSKGIWQLNRDLTWAYAGAPVEQFNTSTVQSSVNVPNTNQVRFTLNTGQTLMFDYYYQQWGTFVGVPAISSCIFQSLHTFINQYGQVFQENPGSYLDGEAPVLLSFTTGPIQTQGISGFQRILELQLLGSYISPHFLNCLIGYDYGPLSEQAIIEPINFTPVYGSDPLYGQTSPYGGIGTLEQWRVQPSTQKCQAFQISVTEIYDPSFGIPAGAGFTLSAVTMVVGMNRTYRPVKATTTVGTN